MRTSKTFNKVVNFDRETKEITVLDDVFSYSDNMKGATGSKFEPISKQQYDEILNEYLNNPQAVSEYWKDNIGEALTYDEIISISSDEDEVISICGGIDNSYSELWDDIREELNLSEDEAYIFNCVGGGRCFDKNFQGNFNHELSEIIREYES